MSSRASAEDRGIIGKIRMTLHEWRLVLQRLRKPDSDEYRQAVKIMWLTIIAVGIVAYIIQFVAVKLIAG